MTACTGSGGESGSGASSSAPAPVGAQVALTTQSATPAQLTISLGTEVYWHDTASAPHRLVFTASASGGPQPTPPPELSVPASGDGHVGFSASGRYGYVCTIHPAISGTVTVQ